MCSERTIHADARRLVGLTFLAIACLLPAVREVYGQWGPSKVEVAPVKGERLAPTVRLVGTVFPKRRTTVAAEVWGFVTEMPVDRGDFIKAGDVICRLRDTQHRFSRDEQTTRVVELESMLAMARAELAKAAFDAERMRKLSDADRSTEKEVVDTAANLDAAKARVGQAEASIQSARSAWERLEDSLKRTQVTAPFDGFVVSKLTEVGSWVVQGGGVVELIDLSVAQVRLNVPESYVAFNEVGTEVLVTIDALGRDFLGTVSRVVPDADPQARTFPVDVDIVNKERLLKSGMFARGSVPAGPVGERLVVPKDAIVTRGPSSYLFVVATTPEGSVADMRAVRIVSEVLDRVAVEVEGLKAGDQVVIRGNEGMAGSGPVIVMSGSAPQKPHELPDNGAATTRPVADNREAADERTYL
ncbi:MAG TPA: efflux RND transporter periplasmic adaptor subunit, partial [Phycisphaerae bacterium]|nr:efflux RND transporter periplasmic adaptor subunit [Phycisphaerae bacterium]